jgi:hypothetical protein
MCDTFRQTSVIYGKLVSEMKVIKLNSRGKIGEHQKAF